jgi:hypothetical protein
MVLRSESNTHWDVLSRLLERGKISGPRVHDGRIAALCIQHGVRERLSADRDFSRFGDLKTRNPLVTPLNGEDLILSFVHDLLAPGVTPSAAVGRAPL